MKIAQGFICVKFLQCRLAKEGRLSVIIGRGELAVCQIATAVSRGEQFFAHSALSFGKDDAVIFAFRSRQRRHHSRCAASYHQYFHLFPPMSAFFVVLYLKNRAKTSIFLTFAVNLGIISAEMIRMTMQEVIARINELARKAKTEGLTPEELVERDALRQRYIASVRENLRAQLDNTYIVDEKGNKRKLKQ